MGNLLKSAASFEGPPHRILAKRDKLNTI